MKILFSVVAIMVIAITNSLHAQCNANSAPNVNYCCGHDPEFTVQSVFHKVDGNFCDLGEFEMLKLTPVIYKDGDWMRIWSDDFNNYSKLDGSFFNAVSDNSYNTMISNDASTTPSSGQMKYMLDPGLVKVNQGGNGKLQLFENYNQSPSKLTPVYQWGEPTGQYLHSDFNVGHVQTKFHFPDGLKIQAEIKTYPMTTPDQWPSFWTYGDNGLELDIFEMTTNNSTQIFTYHAKDYASSSITPSGILRSEGTTHTYFNVSSTSIIPVDLSANFHTYGLVWDDWALVWVFDYAPVHRTNRFYKLNSNWSNSQIKKHYRALPVHSATDWSNHGGYFYLNKHFPTYIKNYANIRRQDAVVIIFNNGFQNHTPLATNIDPNASMDMDNLNIWVKANCSETRNITASNVNTPYLGLGAVSWPYTTAHKGRNYLEAAGTLIFAAGNNFTVEPSQMGLFVATNEISFQDGFGVAELAEIFAFITIPCEKTWDNREIPTEPTPDPEIDEDDGTPYFHQNGDIDTEEINFQDIGGRKWNPTGNSSNGILNSTTETSKNNPLMNHDIVLKTEEDGFTLESSGSKITAVELLDSKGAVVLRNTLPSSNIYKISRQILAEGIYTCIIYTSVGVEIRKIWVFR